MIEAISEAIREFINPQDTFEELQGLRLQIIAIWICIILFAIFG